MPNNKSHFFLPWSNQNNAKRINIEHAEGCELTLSSGQKVTDLSSQIFNANIGHAHPRMGEIFTSYAKNPKVMLPNAENKFANELAEQLKNLFPTHGSRESIKTFFTLGGAEATEHAIKIARMVTGKHKIITRYRSYHGSTIAAMNVSGDYRRIPTEGGMTGIVRFPDPYELGSRQKIDTVTLLEEIIAVEGPETIACVLLEGITGTSGVFIPPKDYWKRIREICTYHNILLIADEVLSGFGRTGRWFGIDHFDVEPDIMTVSKGLTGGYAPLGAAICNEAVAQFFDEYPMYSGLTGYAPELSCAVASECIHIYREENLIENANSRGSELTGHLLQLKENCPKVLDVRSIGLLSVIELEPLEGHSIITPLYNSAKEIERSNSIRTALLNNGIFTFVKLNKIFVAPPLCITQQELQEAMQKVEMTLKA